MGQLDHRKIAALAGHAADSGGHRGKRHIWDGRETARRALCIAAFIASRSDPAIKAFRKRLQDAGKSVKIAVFACAKRLLTIFNAMAKNDENDGKHGS